MLKLAPLIFLLMAGQAIAEVSSPPPALYAGPNCWNFALYSAGLAKGLRHTEPDEFSFFMENSCKRLPDGAARKAGDIVALRMPFNSGTPMEKHAQVVVTSTHSMSKNTFQPTSGYTTQTNEALFDLYDVSTASVCRNNRSSDVRTCDVAVDVFRCEGRVYSPDEIAWLLPVKALEARLQARLSGPVFLTTDDVQTLEQHLNHLSSVLPPSDLTKTEARVVLSSLLAQLDLLALTSDPDRDEVEGLASLVYSAIPH